MRKTTAFKTDKQTLMVDTESLMNMLQCGRASAVQIGTSAGVRIQIGRRILWNVSKIQAYLDEISE